MCSRGDPNTQRYFPLFRRVQTLPPAPLQIYVALNDRNSIYNFVNYFNGYHLKTSRLIKKCDILLKPGTGLRGLFLPGPVWRFHCAQPDLSLPESVFALATQPALG